MIPQPKTKRDEIAQKIWPVFLNDEKLDEFTFARARHELESLKRVDREGYNLLSAVLAAIEGNHAEVLRLADMGLTGTAADVLLNWSTMLVNIGLIVEAHGFALKAWRIEPGFGTALDLVIALSEAIEDAPTLEEALTAWHKMHAGEAHPLEVVHMLTDGEGAQDLTDEELVHFLDKDSEEDIDSTLTIRARNLTRRLLDKVEHD